MKCSECGSNVLEQTAKFCSQCGHKLPVQPIATQDAESQPQPLKADFQGTTEKSGPQKNVPSVDSMESTESPKQQNGDNQKKKKKKKKNKKKKDGNILSDQDQSLSYVSPEDDHGTQGRRCSSGSESSNKAMDETPDSPQDEASSVESQPSSLVGNSPAAPPEDAQVTQSENPAATRMQLEESQGQSEVESNTKKSNKDQTVKTAASNIPTQHPTSEDKGTTVASKRTKDPNPKDQKADRKKSKKEVAATEQPSLDQNANVEPSAKQTGQTKQKAKSQQDQKQNQTAASTQKMVFGSGRTSETVSTGSSVDPEVKGEHMEVQQPASGKDSTPAQTSEDGEEDKTRPNTPAAPPPKRLTTNQTIAAQDRLTIYFHAVLSKDFKFDVNEDRIFIRAGSLIGSWEDNAAELQVTRCLGDHGFLVEGSLTTSKRKAESMSIPYKYLVYNTKKLRYEYEFIYKVDSGSKTTNRCLFVKSKFLNAEGDWHQYDDIICAQPSKNMLKRLKETLWPEQRTSLIQGREIAGKIMLSTIFDLLSSWSEINLNSFLIQLNQFFDVYGEPHVYEETHKKWYSLNYGTEDVKKMLREFMLASLILLKDGDGQRLYISDPMRAAAIMLFVCKRHAIHLKDSELYQICNMLCLPKKGKEDFLQYWADFSKDVFPLKNLPEYLVSLINSVKKVGNPSWILVLPLLHLLKGAAKPFEIPTTGNMKYGLSWAGLQGIDARTYMNSQERRALVNVIKSHSHLMEVDALLTRSRLFLLTVDELVEWISNIDVELLDILLVFLNKAPEDVSYMNSKGVTDILSHIQMKLIEEKFSYFTEAYRRDCLATAVKLLEKICKAVKPTSYGQDNTHIPVACMNLVASVSDLVHSKKQQ